MRRLLRHSWLVFFVIAAGGGCRRRPASMDDCVAVLDKLVELELEESGYRDPVVRARWADEARRRFASELARCPGLLVRDDLHACLRAARTSEAIVHGCVE